MISMEMMGKIRRMYFRDKLSLHEIAKRTGLARNTIRKWVRAPEAKQTVYQRRAIFNKLSPFHATLEQALKADSLRPKQQRRSAKALLAQIKAEGYDGGYSQLTAFIRAWRGGQGKASQAFVPLTFALGEAFQFDWSEEGLLVGGIYRRMQVAHLKLCASRAFWLVAYPSQGHEMLFDAHTRSFGSLGGVPRRGIYDNMKTAVDKVNKGKGRTVNARFAVMCAHYLFDPDFCNVAAGWEKGIVKKNVQDSRRRIWLDAQDCQFHSFEELNAWLGQRCRALWNELTHPQYSGLSVAEVLELERAELMPVPAPFDGYVERPARVSSTCLVSVGRNRYSVPCEYAGKRVSSRLYPTRIEVVADDALRNGAPFADLPVPLRQLKHGLGRHAGGDRIMAQVLAAVPVAGLDAVLVAVELVLESGSLSAEHILNVVARLTASEPPPSVETHLSLKEAPVANTARYDRLRGQAEEVGHA